MISSNKIWFKSPPLCLTSRLQREKNRELNKTVTLETQKQRFTDHEAAARLLVWEPLWAHLNSAKQVRSLLDTEDLWSQRIMSLTFTQRRISWDNLNFTLGRKLQN